MKNILTNRGIKSNTLVVKKGGARIREGDYRVHVVFRSGDLIAETISVYPEDIRKFAYDLMVVADQCDGSVRKP